MEEQDAKHNEILKAVSDLSGKFDGLSKKTDDLSVKFDGLSEKTDEILEAIGHFSNETEKRFMGVEKRLDRVEGDMVTKSYLDEKLFYLKGDLITLTRKEDAKLAKLVDILENKNVITHDDAGNVLALEPFPR